MLTWMQATTDLLWRNALVLVPMAAFVLILCRFIPNRPATRHSLWLCLVVWLVAGTLLPPLRLSTILTAADRGADDIAPAAMTDNLEFLEAAVAVDFDETPESPPPTLFECAAASPLEICTEAAEPRRETPHDLIRDILARREPQRPAPAMPREPTPTPPRTVASVASDMPPISLPASAGVGRLSTFDHPARVASEAESTPVPLRIGVESASNDVWPSCFPLPLDVALGMHLSPQSRAPRYTYDPGHFHESLERASTVLPDREINAAFDNPALLVADLRSQAQQWAAALVGIRDAVGRLPALPLWLWFAGVLLVVTIRLRHLVVFRRHILAATTANDTIRGLVAEVSRDIGLRRTPRVVITNARISPMIWCGRITTLVLPRSLWRELDEPGRRAILYHELAHVRRRDHIIVWIEWIVGALYWWHPLVWWVRSRLSEEAENCCDAWVTWLMPRGRRAYAEALLRTKQFADDSEPVKPAVGIGILTGRAKRFARRLTMVMTQKTAPTGSARSIALIACVSLIGWLATPALSLDEKPAKSEKTPTAAKACSEVTVTTEVAPCSEKDKKTCASACTKVGDAPCPSVVVLTEDGAQLKAGTICVETCKTPPAAVSGTNVVRVAPAARVVTGVPAVPALPALSAWSVTGDEDDDEDLAARLERLERHMEQLTKKLEKLNHWQPATPMPPVAPVAPEHLKAYEEAAKQYQLAMPDVGFAQFGGEPDVVRTYALPEGRLEALVELMVREDVPVRVRPVDGGIEVHGPESVQANFKAFVEIITSDEEQVVEYILPKGQLDALQALMVRSDVPVIVSPGEGKIAVHGDAATQAVFRNFVEMLSSKKRPATLGTGKRPELHVDTHPELAEALEPVMEQLQKRTAREARERARAERQAQSEYRRQAHRMKSEAMEQAIKELTRHSEEIEREIERLEREADKVERKAEEIRMKAEQLRKKARMSSGAAEEELELRADEAEAKADALMAHADSIHSQVEQMEDEATAIEDKIEAMEDELEDIDEEPGLFDA